ncbi:Protein of unknown function DUF726 [Dillenia turbinata]|uniref:Transmembrane and coiled-coil domain-containing protein 4 n=1 Tax=Dillenia turbinata TaxID=194707 RepID=A0AAN8V2X0_9MAGN
MAVPLLTPTQKYAAGALFTLALHQAQIHQSRPLGCDADDEDRINQRISSSSSSSGQSSDSVSDDPQLWVHESFGLLRPVFRILEIDSKAWTGLEETAGSSMVKLHVGAFLRLVAEDEEDTSSEKRDQELALSNAVDSMALSMESSSMPSESKREKHREYEQERREKCSITEMQPDSEAVNTHYEALEENNCSSSTTVDGVEATDGSSSCKFDETPVEEETMLSYQRKLCVLYELLSACLADVPDDKKILVRRRKGYDARHRLAAPAIAAGFGALAPTLGTLIPVIGASGFAAAASAAGSVAGSVAIAASFGAAGAGLSGTKMARRIGDVDEFEFKAIGENHNQGRLAVGIMVSGFVFEEEDFVMPWEAEADNLEKYALQWESKNLIAVSTAIQDWLTSRVAMELMKQGAMMTVLSTLLTALAWPAALLAVTDFIDSKWTIAVDRSDKAGKLLAEVLMKGLQGNRPVTLVGYSLGARVIFKCLQLLAESENNAGLVERVVLLGAPISFKDENWEAARRVIWDLYTLCCLYLPSLCCMLLPVTGLRFCGFADGCW